MQSCQVQMIKNLDHFPDHFRKKYFRNKFISAIPPPSPKNFRSVYHFRGQKIFVRNYKLQILPHFYANIARLPFLGQQTADFFAFWLFYCPILPNFYANIARLPLFQQQTADFFAFLLANIAQFLRKYCTTTFI